MKDVGYAMKDGPVDGTTGRANGRPHGPDPRGPRGTADEREPGLGRWLGRRRASGKRTLIAGWTIWLAWMTVLASGSALAGECPNVFFYPLRNVIYSDCEARSSGQHFVFRIDKSDFFSGELAASVLEPFEPAAGGPIPYFTPVYYGFYESTTGDACALISYPLNDVREIVGTSGRYYCLVASESNTAGGREQRISGQWFIVPGAGTNWEGIRMTDSAIPWSLTLDSSGSGSGTIGGAGSYVVGESISLTAIADSGSTFTGWSGDAPCAASFTMPDADVSCTANFTLNSHAVSTSSGGTGSGSTGGDGTYVFNSTVTLTASPATGSTFTGWSGHPLCAPSFSMPDEAVSCTAIFTLNSYAITTTASPAAGGTVDCSPNPVDHGSESTCTPSATLGYTFAGFSGDCSGTTCVLTNVTADRSVTADFTLNSHAVSTSSGGTGSGSTGGDGTYDFGSTVTLTASADTGSTFTGWSGHPLCAASFSMPDEAVSCVASFSVNSYAITTTASPAAGGTVDCNPNPVDHGSESTCTASANLGYTFAGFSGDCSGTTCVLTNVTADRSVSADFTLNSHAVSTSSGGTGSGSTGGDGTYDFGSTVTLTATPDIGSTFTEWSGHPLCAASFSMPDEAVSCVAIFILNSYAITTTASPAVGGTVDCSPNPVEHGGESTCTATATPGEGYELAGFSGDCSGPNCSLVSITSPQHVTAHFDPVTEIVLVTRAGSEASLSVSGPGCRIVEGQFVSAPSGGPANVTFPFGLLDFTLRGCTGEAVVTVTYPTALPSDAGYWKEADGVFSPYPADFSGNSVTFTLVDNGSGDSDPTAGTIRDPSGVGFVSASAITSIPLLSPWSALALALFMALIAGWRIAHA